MGNVSLEEKEKLMQLDLITQTIANIYEKLFDLYISNKQETEEYEKLMDYLFMSIDAELQSYKDLNLDYDKKNIFMEYFEKIYPENEDIIYADFKDIIKERIYNNLESTSTEISLNKYGLEDNDSDEQLLGYEEKIIFFHQRDVLKIFIKKVNELINNNRNIKKELIKIKLIFSFIYNEPVFIENELLLQFSNINILIKLYEITLNECEDAVCAYKLKELRELIKKSKDLKKIEIKYLLNNALINANYELMDIDSLNYLKRYIKQLNKNNEYFDILKVLEKEIKKKA